MKNQSVATMSVKDLELIINQIIDQKLENLNLTQQDNLKKTKVIQEINNLRAEFKTKYGEFPDSTNLLQEDRIR